MNVPLLEVSSFRHYEFPVTAKKVFMAHAASSPLPRRVASAMADYLETASAEGQWEYIYAEAEEDARACAARLLGAQPEEIAFVSSTSMGLSLVAGGLSWNKGDNVIIADGDFPANIYPWLNLRRLGVNVKFIPRHSDGSVTADDVMDLVDAKTRLVSLSSVNYISGYRIDTPAIGKALDGRGVLFCVDAIQSLGAIPIDTTFVDYLACGGHKWLLAPLGIGILYVKKRNIGKMAPALAGWKSVQGCKNYLDYELRFLDSAARLEPGGMNITGIIGLRAALELLLETGIGEIAGRLAEFRAVIRPALAEKSYDLIGPGEDDKSSGIISFSSGRTDIPRLREALDDSGFVVSLRDGLDGRKCIRISPHFYNTEEEIARLLDKIPAL